MTSEQLLANLCTLSAQIAHALDSHASRRGSNDIGRTLHEDVPNLAHLAQQYSDFLDECTAAAMRIRAGGARAKASRANVVPLRPKRLPDSETAHEFDDLPF